MNADLVRNIQYTIHLARLWRHADTGYLVALAYLIDGGQRVEVICPYCGCLHRHSMPRQDLEPRRPHCLFKAGRILDSYHLHIVGGPLEPWVRAAAEALRPLVVELARKRRPVWW